MTQSARSLGMTQSAVSQTIASLEHAIDAQLFNRSVRPIALTTGGKILLERARQIIQDTHDTFRETQTLEQRKLATLTLQCRGIGVFGLAFPRTIGRSFYRTILILW